MSSQNSKSLQMLLDSMNAFKPEEQAALELLAVMYAPVARTPFASCLHKVGLMQESGRKNINQSAVIELLDKFVQCKLAIVHGGGYCCNPLLSDFVIRNLQKDGRLKAYADVVQSVIAPREAWGEIHYRSYEHCLQDLRIALYLGYSTRVKELLSICSVKYRYEYMCKHPLLLLCGDTPDCDWLRNMPKDFRLMLVTFYLEHLLIELKPADVLMELLEEILADGTELSAADLKLYLSHHLLRGNINKVRVLLESRSMIGLDEMRGWLAVLEGDLDRAIDWFEKGMAVLKKQTGKRKVFFHNLSGPFYLLALIRSGLPRHLQLASELAAWAVKQRYSQQFVFWLLHLYAEMKLGNNSAKPELETFYPQEQRESNLGPVSQFFYSMVGQWISAPVSKSHLNALKHVNTAAGAGGYFWIAAESGVLLAACDAKSNVVNAELTKFFSDMGIVSIAGYEERDIGWERSLNALILLGNGSLTSGGAKVAAKPVRIVWLVSDEVEIQPVEQKQSARGWSVGRNIALRRLKDDAGKLDYLTAQDHKIAACIKKSRSGYYYGGRDVYEFDTAGAISAMIGHPLVYHAVHQDQQICVEKGEFRLEVKRSKGKLSIRMVPALRSDSRSFFNWEGKGRLQLYEPTDEQRRTAGIIGPELTIPLAAEAQVMAAITAISPHVTIHSDVAGENSAAEIVEANSCLQIVLRPHHGGISQEIMVLPLGEGGPRFLPGRGGATVIAEVQGKKLQTSRNMALEQSSYAMVTEACPVLEEAEVRNGVWSFDNPELSLALLEQLNAVVAGETDRFNIIWPEGERLKLRGRAEWPKLKFSVSSERDWFALEGEISVSDDAVYSLRSLLELMEGSSGHFIQLAEGEFLALTEEFRRKIQDLQRLMEKNGRFTPLVAPLIEETIAGAGGISGDKRWKADMKRFKSAQELQPLIPKTLQAELRDYQSEGFGWLSRLAHWGVGACLADDMGLGKTLQALTLLLTRAAAGPALVLAPTSVCFNWESEAHRFAPALNPRIFGSGNRADFVASLAPFDLVICSYTLFQQEAELLTGVEWETVVLDEAQAIKNMATKRSQAAMQLKAGFRIATTGTPVENRLSELWNLFRFLNPGLLGSQQSFNGRFATPIEKFGDKNARNLLKRLIRPFVLRRTKGQVLEELPPRIDIVHRIELSSDEAAFYEVLRQNAVEQLAQSADAPAGERQIRILAEIMRLRRACCNPELVQPGCEIPSAKLEAFREIVAELRDNGHRALVFSQFVDHLTILRRELENDGISFQYLDGSTQPKDRQQRVAAFQGGEGELFLISLKAGGVGLNLTAADYVIHMDPWWNPAVEDQASDRAHRIGQTRPVTVYRIVAANTIEEKIVALHHQKRDLADSLLEGTEASARITADDLMDLLRETRE